MPVVVAGRIVEQGVGTWGQRRAGTVTKALPAGQAIGAVADGEFVDNQVISGCQVAGFYRDAAATALVEQDIVENDMATIILCELDRVAATARHHQGVVDDGQPGRSVRRVDVKAAYRMAAVAIHEVVADD